MVYNTKHRCLTKDNGEKVKLTRLDHKLLIALSNGKLTLYDEIAKFMYGCNSNLTNNSIKCIKKNLCKKTDLEIRAVSSRGYILESNISYK